MESLRSLLDTPVGNRVLAPLSLGSLQSVSAVGYEVCTSVGELVGDAGICARPQL